PNKVDVEYRPHSSQIAQGNHSKEESDNSGDEEAIKAALKNVLDPELGINVVDLGLIYGIHQSSGAVTIDLTLTTPGCPMINEFCASVKQAVQQLPGINDVQVNLTFDPPWNPSKMSPEAADELGLFI